MYGGRITAATTNCLVPDCKGTAAIRGGKCGECNQRAKDQWNQARDYALDNWTSDDVVIVGMDPEFVSTLAKALSAAGLSVFCATPETTVHKYRWAATTCRLMLVVMDEDLLGLGGSWPGWLLAEGLLCGVCVIPVWYHMGLARFRSLVEQRMVGWLSIWNLKLGLLDDRHLTALQDVANRHFPHLVELFGGGIVLEDVVPVLPAFCHFVVDRVTKVLAAMDGQQQQQQNVYAIDDVVLQVDKQYRVTEHSTDLTYGKVYMGEAAAAATASQNQLEIVVSMEVAEKGAKAADQVSIILMRDVMRDETNSKRFIRDLTILRMLDSPFVLRVRDIVTIPRRTATEFADVLYVVDHFYLSLHDLIAMTSADWLQIYDDTVKSLCYGIVRGLMYIHSAKVVHRDLSPKSYLVASNPWRIVLAEFGLARPVGRDGSIQKEALRMAYRAPEVIADRLVYGFPMDLWAAGMIMAEMFTGRPFATIGDDGGGDLANQLDMIVRLVGTPTDEQIARIADPTAKVFIQGLPKRPRAVRAKLVVDCARRQVPDPAQQLIDSLLVWGPSARPSAIQCLKSPYFEDIRQIETELESSVILPPQFDFEIVRMGTPAKLQSFLRDLVRDEVDLYHIAAGE